MEFFKRYNYIIIATFVVVTIVSLGLFYMQFLSRYKHEMIQIESKFAEHVLSLNYMMKAAINHVDAMQITAHSYLNTHQDNAAPSGLFSQLENFPKDNYYALDHVKAPFNQEQIGNLTGNGSLKNRSPSFYREINMALSLNPQFVIAKHNIPNAAWTYYTSSRKFINLYPWVASQDFRFGEETYTHEFYSLGLPENNPNRQRFWSSAYIDEAGKGLMVTCATPVYEGDNFRGTVALDFTLDVLNTFVKDFEYQDSVLFVVNQNHQLLAHPTLVNSKDKTVKTVEMALPETLRGKLKLMFQTQPQKIHEIGSHFFIFQNLTNVPWKLVLWTHKSDIVLSSIYNTSWGFLVLLPGLALILIITNRVTRKEFIIPAGLLVKHIEDENRGIDSPIPKLPTAWQTWFETVSNIFKRNRDLLAQLQASHATLESKNEELQQLDKLKDEFLANTSHELRTPLHGIIGIAESLLDGATGQLPQQTRSNLVMIVGSGRRLSNLVNDILDFSKLRHKNLELQIKPLNMQAITGVVLTLSQPLVGKKTLQLVNRISPDLPPVAVDENRIQQIMHNLVGNAIKFTENGCIEVSAKVVEEEKGNGAEKPGKRLLEITVSDTGIGIGADKIDKIFEFFEQADGSTARQYGGTGLGLAITKQLVELHSGQIRVESTMGVGSQIIFTLPIDLQKNNFTKNLRGFGNLRGLVNTKNLRGFGNLGGLAPNIYLDLESAQVGTTNECSPDGHFNIMIVDDEPVNHQVLINNLSLCNYTITPASSGFEALDILENGLMPDLILLDVMMPRMTGYEVTREIRKTHTMNELPILLLTAKNQILDLVTGLESGANDYITKPIAKEELLARIKTHLHLKQLNSELKQAVQATEAANKALNQTLATLDAKVVERTAQLNAKVEELTRTRNELVQSEKMASLGRLVAGFAHELNTPIGVAVGAASNLQENAIAISKLLEQEEVDEDELVSTIESVEEATSLTLSNLKRAAGLVSSFKRTAVDQTSEQIRKFNVKEAIFDVVNTLHSQFKRTTIETKIDCPNDLFIYGVPGTLEQLLTNLMMNSLIHGFADGQVTGQIMIIIRLQRENLHIEYSDTGNGITAEILEKIFEPFFTTHRTHGGSGLGLYICYNLIAIQSHGTITCESSPNQGVKFIIDYPSGQP